MNDDESNDSNTNNHRSHTSMTFPESELVIDKHYAQHYEQQKQREEYSKLKDIYGDDVVPSDLSDNDNDKDDENQSGHDSHEKTHTSMTVKSSSKCHTLSHSRSQSEDNEDEDDDEEDEIGELLTPEVNAQVLRTISLIRSKDPMVYDTSKNFFEEQDMEEVRRSWKQRQQTLRSEPKKITLKDYERDQIVSQMKVAFPNDNADESSSSKDRNSSKNHDKVNDASMMTQPSVVSTLSSSSSGRPMLMTPAQEQEQARQELIEAFHRFADDISHEHGNSTNQKIDIDIEDNMIHGGLFRQRIKSREELDQEEETYRKFLLAEEEKEREKRVEELATLRRFWTDPNLDESERFLRE